ATHTISGSVSIGEAAVGATVFLYDNGGATAIGSATVADDGSWATSVTLAGDGSHSIVAKDTDAAGNTGTSTPVVFTLDTIAPTVTINTTGGTTNVATQTISGKVTTTEAAPGATVTLFDTDTNTQLGTTTIDGAGNWTKTITLVGDGAHHIVAEDTDAAG